MARARNLDSQHHRGVPSCAATVSREAVSRVSKWMKSFHPAVRTIVILVGNAVLKPGVPNRIAGPLTIQTSWPNLLQYHFHPPTRYCRGCRSVVTRQV
jgi:hypothetical protein